jgi:hypothetical protein
MIEPDVNLSREEIAAFLASLKKLRDGLDDFNCKLAAINGAGMRLGLLGQETAAACPAAEFQQWVDSGHSLKPPE